MTFDIHEVFLSMMAVDTDWDGTPYRIKVIILSEIASTELGEPAFQKLTKQIPYCDPIIIRYPSETQKESEMLLHKWFSRLFGPKAQGGDDGKTS